MAMDARLRPSGGPHADARLRGDARGGYGGIRKELAEGVVLRSGSPLSGANRKPLAFLSFSGLTPKRSIWCNADAAPEACLFNCFLNDAGLFRLFDNLVEFGLSSRRSPFRQRHRDPNGIERTRYDLCAGVAASNRVDQSRVCSKHVCFAAA